jgi:serine/threonine protein kinase
MSASPPEPLQYAHYDVVAKLGQGAMGVVYLAKDRRIGRRVALKLVRPQNIESVEEAKEFFARLQREAELSGALNHPNIATLYEVGYEKQLISFLAMEYVEGETLQSILKRKEPLAVASSLIIVEDVLEGLAYAHTHGVIHRDIKPANIIVRPDGRAKILDFGIARREESNLTMSGSFVGTPNYMSPEQVKSETITPRIDLFSLGVVLYEMLTATRPFAAETMTAVMYNIVERQPEALSALRSDIPAPVDAFVARMIAKNPDDRFPSASDALAAIRRLRADEAQMTAPPEPPPVAVVAEPQPVRSPWWKRSLPARPVVILISIVALSTLIWLIVVARQLALPIEARHTTAQLQEFRSKENALHVAAQLRKEGKRAEARAAYEAYLKKYPSSVPARESLQAIAMEEQAVAQQAAVPPAPESASKKKATAPSGGEPKPGRMQSLKKKFTSIFRRN